MAQKIVVARKWGNSIGVALPSEVIREENIMPNDKLVLSVRKVVPLKDIFGKLKMKESAEEILKEIRTEDD